MTILNIYRVSTLQNRSESLHDVLVGIVIARNQRVARTRADDRLCDEAIQTVSAIAVLMTPDHFYVSFFQTLCELFRLDLQLRHRNIPLILKSGASGNDLISNNRTHCGFLVAYKFTPGLPPTC
jgi:hypothetical protein